MSYYIALDLLHKSTDYTTHYTEAEKASFEAYLEQRIALIDLPNKDEIFLRERILTMYANPLINHLKSLDKS